MSSGITVKPLITKGRVLTIPNKDFTSRNMFPASWIEQRLRDGADPAELAKKIGSHISRIQKIQEAMTRNESL